MRYTFLFFVFTIILLPAIAQKRLIDSTAFRNWINVEHPSISNDGKYIVYTINKKPTGSNTLVVQDIDMKWKKEIIGASDARYSQDSRMLLLKLNNDSLCVLELGTPSCKYYHPIQEYQLVGNKKKEWLILKSGKNGKELRIKSLNGNEEKKFMNVTDFAFSGNGKSLLIQTEQQSEEKIENILNWVDLETWNSIKIWESVLKSGGSLRSSNFSFDAKDDQVLFLTSDLKSGKKEKTLWYYKKGMGKAIEKLSGPISNFPEGCVITAAEFEADGRSVLFEAKKQKSETRKKASTMVDVWSYHDNKLQSLQLKNAGNAESYKGLLTLADSRVILLQGDDERLYDFGLATNHYMLLTTTPCYYLENYWRPSCRVPLYLINGFDGTRRLIKDSLLFCDRIGISREGKYVLYYDYEKQAYFSYNISNSKIVNVSQNIPFPIFQNTNGQIGFPKPYSNPNTWITNEEQLIVYDEYDIWQVDVSGGKPPVCLTNGFGRKHRIVLRLLKESQTITEEKTLLIGFRQSDKANGFYQLNLRKEKDPEVLTLNSYLYYWPDLIGATITKAKEADTWLVQRMNATEASNYFTTKDFKRFKQISNVQPHLEYNWFTSELHEWTTYKGEKLQGILYKPENFDSTKKYPVIFNFYEQRSNEVNLYLTPEFTGHNLNIPHFVSNGYLVFVPDIHYIVGEPAESVFMSVNSAADYLSKMPYVDSTKFGLQGHSFGGYEVNVLVTKTKRFAAAAEAAGGSDLLTGYGSLGSNGESFQFKYERGQYRLGFSVFDNPVAYLQNSPVFYANNVKTPILIMHCKNDGSVVFEQAVEWFTAMRRLDKRAWMLQYDNQGHQLSGPANIDYTIRLMQFFNHYLKSAPAPIWMTQGIPARLKGIETGYAYDPAGNCGKDCKVCKSWNSKMATNPTTTLQEIERRKKEECWE